MHLFLPEHCIIIVYIVNRGLGLDPGTQWIYINRKLGDCNNKLSLSRMPDTILLPNVPLLYHDKKVFTIIERKHQAIHHSCYLDR